MLASAGLVLLAVEEVLTYAIPGSGPLGNTGDPGASWVDVAITVVVAALLVNGLRKGHRVAWRWAVAIAGLNVLIAALVAAIAVYAAVQGVDIEIDSAPLFAANGLVWIALFVLLVAGRGAFRVPSRRRRRKALAVVDGDRFAARLREHGGGAVSWMGTWPENRPVEVLDGRCCQPWQSHAGVAIGIGDPVGPVPLAGAPLRDFAHVAGSAGLVPCVHLASDDLARLAADDGWESTKVTENLVVDLAESSFEEQITTPDEERPCTIRIVTLAEQAPALVTRLGRLVEGHRQSGSLPELGLAAGGVEEALDRNVRVALAEDRNGLVLGAAAWLPVHTPGGRVHGWTSDLVVRRDDSPAGVIDLLLVASCLWLRNSGAATVVLKGEPPALGGDRRTAEWVVLDRLFATLAGPLGPPFGFGGVRPTGADLRIRREPVHLLYRDVADLPRIGFGLTRAYLPQTTVTSLLRAAAHR